MKDIFADWKTNKFILTAAGLTNDKEHVIILTDVGYWVENLDALVDWCSINTKAHIQGMVVLIEDDRTLTHFILRWA
jgi:hypothetical protein